MGLKEFLKPTKLKLLLFALAFCIISSYLSTCIYYRFIGPSSRASEPSPCRPEVVFNPILLLITPFTILAQPIVGLDVYFRMLSLLFAVIAVVISYIVGCALASIIGKALNARSNR